MPPLYEYYCKKCDTVLELYHKVSHLEKRCPKCEELGLQKLITPFGGYNIKGNNSGSTKPKGSGSFRK